MASPLPKFGEWDVNDPASAEGNTAIFNIARDEKRTGGNVAVDSTETARSQQKQRRKLKYSIKVKNHGRQVNSRWAVFLHET
ncbi:RPM1-interacting protein 4-like [Hibiscus syriacus]|uniref:RPM1-interacting protein 4-like n=1 Tax=Hibiscus syriacus TaxID=106335 RepID=UPI0019216174|nr:RPM1-interacting protein 4-like [Hibiscus syriacus]